MIAAAEERGKMATANEWRHKRDLAYIDDVHGFYKEIARLLAAGEYGKAYAAMQSAGGRLAVMADALRSIEKL